MDYMPQFGQNIPNQDVGTQDDATAQLLLKRRLAQADALRGQQMPQGQMVSGHYVAPSWTQYLANAVGQYKGKQEEQKAMQDYANAQATKQQKYAELLGQNDNAKFQAGLAQMPEFAPELVKARLAAMSKEEQPIIAHAGDVGFNRKGEQIFAVPDKANKLFGTVNPGDFTPTSLAKYAQTQNYADLVPVAKQQTETNVGKLMAEMNALAPNDPRRAFYQQAIRKETTVPQDFTQQTFKYNQARGLREDFAGLPEVKAWNVIQPTLVAARQAAKDTSGGSDLNLIYAMGKIMDPNSVVREGELQMAGDTGSLGQKIMGYYKSVAKGGKLPPTVKQDLLAQIENRAKAQESLYKNTKAKYTDIAKRNQINPEDLFVEGITAPSNTVNFGDLK